MPRPTSTLAELQELGVFSGLGDVYIAFLTTKGDKSTAPTYETPILAAEGINVTLTPNYAEGSLSASNRTIRKMKILKSVGVSLEYPRIKAAVLAALHGQEIDELGGEAVGDATPADIALGIKATRDDGTMVMRWLFCGQLTEGNNEHQTEEDGAINYATPTLEGDFVPLPYEVTTASGKGMHVIQYKADTANADCDWTDATFFQAVCGPWTQAIPT